MKYYFIHFSLTCFCNIKTDDFGTLPDQTGVFLIWLLGCFCLESILHTAMTEKTMYDTVNTRMYAGMFGYDMFIGWNKFQKNAVKLDKKTEHMPK